MGGAPTPQSRCEAWHLAKKCIEEANNEYQIKTLIRHIEEIKIFAEERLKSLRQQGLIPPSKKNPVKKPAAKKIKKSAKRK